MAEQSVRDLVQQVKAGQKDVSELTNLLSSRAARPETDDADVIPDQQQQQQQQHDDEIGGGGVDEDTTGVGGTGGRFSQEDRRLLINKLIEKRREGKMAGGSSSSSSSGSQGGQGGNNYESMYEGDDDGGFGNDISLVGSERGNDWRRASSGSGGGSGSRQQQYMRRSMDDSMIAGDARSKRIAQTEMAIRSEMFKECRFRPIIKELPSSIYSGNNLLKDRDTNFYDRVTKWQKEKETESARRKKNYDVSEVQDCTFKPKINRNSERAVKEIRGDDTEDAAERLYKSNEVAFLQRARFIEEELQRERREEELECTFHPQLVAAKGKFSQVKSKFGAASKRKEVAPGEHPDLKTCTFTPKVKGVRSSMSSAQLYVSTNVVDRLTRPIVVAPPDNSSAAFDTTFNGDRPVIDVASFMGSLQAGGGGAMQTPGQKGRPTSAPPRGSGVPVELTEEEAKARKAQFALFLGRQEQSQLRRERHIEESNKAQTPSFHPKLCRKSLELSTQHHKGEFLERVHRDVLRREDSEQRTVAAPDAGCTFQPQITTKSAKMPARPVHEMSRGDLLRKEQNQRMMRLRSEQEELSNLTFKPTITKKAKQIAEKGSSRLAQDPAKYLEVHKSKQEGVKKRREEEILEREKQEVENCTFAPATKDCPAYVKRIAKSMSVVREARKNSLAASEKPKEGWK